MVRTEFPLFPEKKPNTREKEITPKIITRMKLLFPDSVADCSYSFQGSVELPCVTFTVSFLFLQNAVTEIIPVRNVQDWQQ